MQTLDLNGNDWKVAWYDSTRGLADKGVGPEMDPTYYFDATVPGEIHLDLMRQGIIDDPRVGMNILKARWVETVLWSYRKHIEVSEEIASARSWLVLEQVDLGAKIYLNGELVGSHANVFYPCRVELTGKLQAGTNRIVVQVESGLLEHGSKPVDDLAAGGRKIQEYMTKRIWMRKPQFQASWDWAARMLNVGLSGPARIEYTKESVRADQFVPLVTLDENLEDAHVEGRWFLEGLGEEATEAELQVAISELDLSVSESIRVEPGLNPVSAFFDVAKPELWWPVGQGEPRRYTLQASLVYEGETIATVEKKIGFRRITVNQDPHPEEGRFFTIEVNNRPVFCKGGNWVPADMIYSAVDRERTETLIDHALDANFNMLRIWGGGLYETEDFYDLCDEKGMMVWQEFIFACGRYPATDAEFYADILDEARYNIRRLSSRPSLVIWCGNNELEMLAHLWKDASQGQVYPDYHLFHYVLPLLMKNEDPTRFYWPSSPWSPDSEPPNANHIGDQHPWIAGMADTKDWMNFQRYRPLKCRFPNEGGFLGPNALPTMKAGLREGDDHMHSFSWRLHDNSFFTDSCKWWVGRERKDMTIEEYAYWGGLVHGEALREYCDGFRHKMFRDCSAAIFWMYNDAWPCSRSWTIVDYYLRRTPAFHPVRRAMAPVNVVLAEEEDKIIIYGINDATETVKMTLRYGVFKLSGDYLFDKSATVELPANASTPIASFDSEEWQNRSDSMCFGTLKDTNDHLIARNKLYEGFLKDLQWPEAKMDVKVEEGKAVFSSPNFVMGVCLDLDGERKLADNFFDLYPGEEYRMPWEEETLPDILHTGNLA
jgi:beta-mannosidase